MKTISSVRTLARLQARIAERAAQDLDIHPDRRDELVAMLHVVASALFMEEAGGDEADEFMSFSQAWAFRVLGRSQLAEVAGFNARVMSPSILN